MSDKEWSRGWFCKRKDGGSVAFGFVLVNLFLSPIFVAFGRAVDGPVCCVKTQCGQSDDHVSTLRRGTERNMELHWAVYVQSHILKFLP